MPIFKNKILAGNQFTGVDELTGRFDPGNRGFTGAPNIETFCEIDFHCEGVATLFELRRVDPEDDTNSTLIYGGALIGAVNDFTREAVRIPTTTDPERKGLSWILVFTTSGMTGNGFYNVNFDFVRTES